MLSNDFAGVTPIVGFLEKYMPKPDTETKRGITKLVKASAEKLAAAEKLHDAATTAAKKLRNAPKNENAVSKPLIEYLKVVVSGFDDSNRPLIEDTHNTKFDALDEAHYTKPDIVSSHPGMDAPPEKWGWQHAGTVIELKHRTDVFDDEGAIKKSDESRDALVQLAKSGRNLLMASRSCVVYTVAVFAFDRARIFRFDRAGFRASSAFNWIEENTIFPTFFWRLYNPTDSDIAMYGQDETVSTPSKAEKQQMYAAFCRNSAYKDLLPLLEATEHSLWIKAARSRVEEDGSRVSDVVTCFTIGPPLSTSDGLFSRATLVYRVILKEDAEKGIPTIYALKDAWRQACRRPEIDFYDVIAKHCEEHEIDMVEKGMAKCHGSLDLSVATKQLGHSPDLHITCSNSHKNAELERCHMRSLLTPVGAALNNFQSTKILAKALQTAIEHHQIAYEAGVLHRDVSEGNVLFKEVTEAGMDPRAFLVDWDYAEFTEEGLDNFNRWFPERTEANVRYDNIEKSLKDMTGTFPFLALERMRQTVTVRHNAGHDLESFYWLLIWIILRHTAHTHPSGNLACSDLFDSIRTSLKLKQGWLLDPSPVAIEVPLFQLAEGLRFAALAQNPPTVGTSKYAIPSNPVTITHAAVLRIFNDEVAAPGWPNDDKALPFHVPHVDPFKPEPKAKPQPPSLHQRIVEKSLKRARGDLEVDDSATVSEGTTAASRGGSGSKKRAKTSVAESESPPQKEGELRRSRRNKGKGSS
ncbi:hypothetical protein DFH09DRAFT_1037340 [Mycena vulgaris]|nr:hypothetical protein DFH09DRAFT_1037340 [Mycena vulgaris]